MPSSSSSLSPVPAPFPLTRPGHWARCVNGLLSIRPDSELELHCYLRLCRTHTLPVFLTDSLLLMKGRGEESKQCFACCLLSEYTFRGHWFCGLSTRWFLSTKFCIVASICFTCITHGGSERADRSQPYWCCQSNRFGHRLDPEMRLKRMSREHVTCIVNVCFRPGRWRIQFTWFLKRDRIYESSFLVYPLVWKQMQCCHGHK